MKVICDIDAGLLLVLLDEVIDDSVVEIFTAEMQFTLHHENFKDANINGVQRSIVVL
jgi:hypothetical protein